MTSAPKPGRLGPEGQERKRIHPSGRQPRQDGTGAPSVPDRTNLSLAAKQNTTVTSRRGRPVRWWFSFHYDGPPGPRNIWFRWHGRLGERVRERGKKHFNKMQPRFHHPYLQPSTHSAPTLAPSLPSTSRSGFGPLPTPISFPPAASGAGQGGEGGRPFLFRSLPFHTVC